MRIDGTRPHLNIFDVACCNMLQSVHSSCVPRIFLFCFGIQVDHDYGQKSEKMKSAKRIMKRPFGQI